MRKIRGFVLITLGLVLLQSNVQAAPEYLRFYKTGQDAADSGDWAQVERMMRKAIEIRPEEKQGWVTLRKGYFPYFYLGKARYHVGDCPGALESWAESERQGAIVGRDDYPELLRLQSDCKKNGRPTLLGKTVTSDATTDKGHTTGKEKVRSGQYWVEKTAEPTSKALGAIESVAPNSEVGKVAHDGQKVVNVAEAATEIVDIVLSPTQALEAAINAYFSGNPQRSLSVLNGIDMSDPRARAQVYLFRAAASFRLHILSGGDDNQLANARKNAELFRREQWRKDFPAEFFDPRFVRFLRGSD